MRNSSTVLDGRVVNGEEGGRRVLRVGVRSVMVVVVVVVVVVVLSIFHGVDN